MNLLQNFHIAVIEYLYCGCRAVPLQMFTTRHSNRKLSIVRGDWGKGDIRGKSDTAVCRQPVAYAAPL